jgi:uncharacterized protein (DUF849 family)
MYGGCGEHTLARAPGGGIPHRGGTAASFWTWHTPDYTSVNVSETGAAEVIGTLIGARIGIEAGVWTVKDVEWLAASGLGDRLTRILVEPGELQLLGSEDKAADAIGLVEDIHEALDRFGLTAPRLQNGDGEVTWALLANEIRRNLDTRIGLEDTLHGPTGERTSGNDAFVRPRRPRAGSWHRLGAR